MKQQQYSITKEEEGIALPVFLRRHFSVRELRRLFTENAITVNTKPGYKKYILRENDTVECFLAQEQYTFPLEILYDSEDFFAIYKPHNTHSVHISGKTTPSIENTLRKEYSFYSLCTRLDYPTSGILIIAKTKKMYEDFRKAEQEKKIVKTYCCVTEGDVEKGNIDYIIETQQRIKSKCIPYKGEDTSRYTIITDSYTVPMHIEKNVKKMQYSFVECTIFRGVRHQIRCHLAHKGNPIVGDSLYGDTSTTMPLFLHNLSITVCEETIYTPIPSFWEEYFSIASI